MYLDVFSDQKWRVNSSAYEYHPPEISKHIETKRPCLMNRSGRLRGWFCGIIKVAGNPLVMCFFWLDIQLKVEPSWDILIDDTYSIYWLSSTTSLCALPCLIRNFVAKSATVVTQALLINTYELQLRASGRGCYGAAADAISTLKCKDEQWFSNLSRHQQQKLPEKSRQPEVRAAWCWPNDPPKCVIPTVTGGSCINATARGWRLATDGRSGRYF